MLVLSFFTIPLIASENTLYELTTYNKPNVGSVSEVYLGDSMLLQQKGAWKECITPRKTYSKTTWGATATYRSEEPICKKHPKSKYYWPTYKNVIGSNASTEPVIWKGKKGKYKLCVKAGGMTTLCIKNLKEDDVVNAGEVFIYSENSFQQTIEYVGRSGDILKFNYSEFADRLARDSFNREFQIDLLEGNIAAYKGAIIEIIEATNVQIKYKVIRNFSSDL